MTLAPVQFTAPEAARPLVVHLIDAVCTDARRNYRITPTTPGTGAVDFHPFAATQARALFSAALAQDGQIAVTLTVQQVEAVDKILRNHRLTVDKESKKLALAVRKAMTAASGLDAVGEEADAA